MKGSIFGQIFGGHLIIILLLTLSFGLSISHLIESFSFDLLKRHLKNLAYGLKPQVQGIILRGDYGTLNSLARKVGETTGVRITIIDPQGVVLADSEEDPAFMENHGDRPEVIMAMAGRVGSSLRWSATLKEEMLYVAIPMKLTEGVAVLRTSFFLRDVNQFLGAFKKRVTVVAVALGLFSLIYAFFSSKRLSDPIKELVQATSRVAQGDFDVRVLPKGRGELGELAERFNEMAAKLKELFQENLQRKEELERIFSSLEDGLLVLDREGKVILFNKKAQEILEGKELSDRSFWEIGDSAFREAISRVRKTEGNLTEELEISGGVFLLSATYLATTGQTLVLLHDITHLKRMQELKRDLVANVSHELRTPLTAIKGFLEAFEDEDSREARSHYLEIIKKHVDRLTNIVQDLLVLSELEDKKTKLDLEDVDLKALLQDVLRPFEEKAKKKGLTLKVDFDPGLPPIKADPFRLQQAFFNLIDNAVKYTEQGEIRISTKGKADHVEIEVADTGIGIPKEHLPRIFERFYVVDKSRSRRLGGTGLGLSIVKHIVLLQGGEIDVESTPGVGTRFRVRLPL